MRHRGLRAPINTIKHYVPQTSTLLTSGNIVNNTLAEAVVAPATSFTFEVREGSLIKAIYVERWLVGAGVTGTVSAFTLTVEKKRVSETDMTVAQSLNLQGYPNKKNILYTTQGILSTTIDGATTIPVIRGWIKIPKGKQRFGLADQIMVNTSTVGDLRLCGISTYKEWT